MPDDDAAASSRILPARYRVERELGRGVAAIVYLCTDMRDGGLVAAKVLRPSMRALSRPKDSFAKSILSRISIIPASRKSSIAV